MAGDQDIVGLNQLEVRKVVQQQGLLGEYLQIGDASGGDLRIHGATTKGSILAGNGTSTIEVPVGTTGYVLKANPATVSGLEWAIDISGVTGVVGVNAGNNISIGGTVDQPIVGLSAPLTSTLGMGTVALTDKNGASGSAGQFLSAGTGGETEWATPPDTLPTISAGNNISVSGTQANPSIALQSPLTTDLFLGSVNMTAGDPTTQTHSITNNGGASYTSALNVGGQLLATYTASSMSISDPAIQKNISIAPATGIFLNDQSTSTILDTTITETQVQVKSQTSGSLTQALLTQADLQYTNTDSTVSPTFTDISNYGNCSRTATSTDNTTGTNATRSDTISRTSGSNQILQYNEVPNFLQFTQTTTTDAVSGCVYQGVSESLVGAGTQQKGAYGLSASTTQGEVSTLYENNTGSPQYQGTGNIITNGGASSMTLTSANISAGQSQLLRLECPASGDALIEHQAVGVVRNLDITTTGQFSATAGSAGFLLSGSAGCSIAGNAGGQLLLTAGSTGGEIFTTSATSSFSSPIYSFENTNASNASYPVMRFSRPIPASTAGDTIGGISYWADDASGVYREWGRIAGFAQNVATGNQDGRIGIWTTINGATPVEVFNFNGADNENNSFRPLDVNGNALKTSSGNLTIESTASSGSGIITLNALQSVNINSGGGSNIGLNTSSGNFTLNTGATGEVQLTGTKLQSNTAGGSSGQHLVITLNGSVYKIALLNP